MTTAPAAVDFFVSRAGADAPLARAVAGWLIDAGHSVILQDWDFGHADFIARMDDALARARRTITLLSPAYLASPFCGAEWRALFARDPRNFGQQLVLLRVGPCQPTGLLCLLAYTDLVPLLDQPALLRELVLARLAPGRRPDSAALLGAHTRAGSAIVHTGLRAPAHLAGRDAALQAIDDALGRAQPVVVTGLGGVGKSALAQAYGLRRQQRYAGVWWLDGRDDRSITEGLIGLGALFVDGLQHSTDPAAARMAALQVLRAFDDRPWLLIVDNVQAGDDLRALFDLPGARVLATSRIGGWEQAVARVDIGPLDRDEAVALLQADSGRSDGAPADWAALATAVGMLPLALCHIAAYLRRSTVVSPAVCLDRLQRLMSLSPSLKDAAASVQATYQLAIDRADGEAPGARALMGLLSMFSDQPIPLEVLDSPPDRYPPALQATLSDPVSRDEATSALVNASLLQHDSSRRTLRLHVLVAQAAQPAHDAAAWYLAARQALYAPLMAQVPGVDPTGGNRVASRITGRESFEQLMRYFGPGLALDLAAPQHGLPATLVALGAFQTWHVLRQGPDDWASSVADRRAHVAQLMAQDSTVADGLKAHRALAFDLVRRGETGRGAETQLALCQAMQPLVGQHGLTREQLETDLGSYAGMGSDAGRPPWVIAADLLALGYRVRSPFPVDALMNGIGIVAADFGLPHDTVLRTMAQVAESSPPEPAAFLDAVGAALVDLKAVPLAVQSLLVALAGRMAVAYVPPLLVWRGLGLFGDDDEASDDTLATLIGQAVAGSASYQQMLDAVFAALAGAGAQEPDLTRVIRDIGSQLETIRRLRLLPPPQPGP